MSLELKYDNCLNCGAPVRGHKCAYCGTEYKVKYLDYDYMNGSGCYSSGYCYSGRPHYFSSSQPLFRGKPINKDNEEEVRKYIQEVPILF